MLRTLTYSNTTGNPGVSSVAIDVVANDGANNSAVATATVNINVRPALDLNGAGSGTGFTTSWSNTGAILIADPSNATLTDDGGTLALLGARLVSPELGDLLMANVSGTSILSSFDGTTLVLSGTASVADYQQVLRSITYDNTNGGFGVGTKLVNIAAHDGTGFSNIAVATIAANAVPLVDLNGSTGGTGFTSLWTNGGPVNVVDALNASVADDGPNLASMTATLASPHPGDVLSANVTGTNILATFTGASLTLTGSDTPAQYQQMLRTLKYDNTNNGPGVSSLTINIVVSDGLNNSNTADATVNINLAAQVDLNGPGFSTSYNAFWDSTAPVSIVSSSATVTDDGSNLASLTATITAPSAGDMLSADTTATNISASFNGTTLTLSGSDTTANYEQVLRSVQYHNSGPVPAATEKVVQFVAPRRIGRHRGCSHNHDQSLAGCQSRRTVLDRRR